LEILFPGFLKFDQFIPYLIYGSKAMRNTAVIVCILLFLSGCIDNKTAIKPVEGQFVDRYMKNVKQLTFDGDNGEAYFSLDDSRLIYQSNRGGYACDKIWTMNVDGSDKRMVSPDRGAHTCSFFFPDGEKIVFASTSHLAGECPPKPKIPQNARYIWPLYPYDIFVANADGSELKKITDNPKYDAEPVIAHDGKQIVFGSQRDGDFDIYIMNSDGSNVRRLTERAGYDGGPWFSPDGSKIVWRAWYPETEEELALWRDCMENDYILPFPLDIWVMDVDGSNKVRLKATVQRTGLHHGIQTANGSYSQAIWMTGGRILKNSAITLRSTSKTWMVQDWKG
jgi:Tol biopolymer transport system component